MADNFKGAFECAKCPGNGDPSKGRACPMWWKTVWQRAQEDVKIVEACGYTQLPHYLTEVIKASNRPAAAVESMRNEMSRGLFAIAEAAKSHPLLVGPSQFDQIDGEPRKALPGITE